MGNFVTERHGFTSAANLMRDVVTVMLNNGFDLIWNGIPGPPGDSLGAWNPASGGTQFRVIMEASGSVDPLNDSSLAVEDRQPWRVCVDVQGRETAFIHVATPLQLANNGGVATEREFISGSGPTSGLQHRDVLGTVGAQIAPPGGGNSAASLTTDGIYSPPTGGNPADETTKGFIIRERRIGPDGGNNPLSYRLVIGPRGFWLGVWEAAVTAETAMSFNWMLVQRPVDRDTGEVFITGKSPVFCVNSVGGSFWQFVVRESDIIRPGRRRSASSNTEDSEAIINIQNQVSLSEDGKYIVTFPSRLNTSRYRYPQELDMIGITSADVVSQNSDVPLTVYNESDPRTYKAMHANGVANTGMRVLVLLNGGGITAGEVVVTPPAPPPDESGESGDGSGD